MDVACDQLSASMGLKLADVLENVRGDGPPITREGVKTLECPKKSSVCNLRRPVRQQINC